MEITCWYLIWCCIQGAGSKKSTRGFRQVIERMKEFKSVSAQSVGSKKSTRI